MHCTSIAPPAAFLLLAWALSPAVSNAHEGHDHSEGIDVSTPQPSESDALTGEGDYRFRFNAELSRLPEAISAGIGRAHGGFAKTPSGEVYFGLEGTGLIRISADLREKTLVSQSPSLIAGGLHNTTFVDRDGGLLVLPDNNTGRVLVVSTDGEPVATLGRPGADIDEYYADPDNGYAPTDTEFVAPDGMVYVTDGYSDSKNVLAVDLDKQAYVRRIAGGKAPKGQQTPAKFSTCHGLVWDPIDETLAIADREHHWVQKLNLDGDFVSGYQVDGGNPCDIDFVEWRSEPLTLVSCLRAKGWGFGVVHLLRGTEIVATLKPKDDLGLEAFDHIHNAVGVVVDKKLYVLCYGWNPGCFAVLEHVPN